MRKQHLITLKLRGKSKEGGVAVRNSSVCPFTQTDAVKPRGIPVAEVWTVSRSSVTPWKPDLCRYHP